MVLFLQELGLQVLFVPAGKKRLPGSNTSGNQLKVTPNRLLLIKLTNYSGDFFGSTTARRYLRSLLRTGQSITQKGLQNAVVAGNLI